MKQVTAVASMLHESVERSSARRMFRQSPVLAWTLERLSRAESLTTCALLIWEDQLPAVAPIAERFACHVLTKGPRHPVGGLESLSAARRWSDGWRGGLLGSCAFDAGYHPRWVAEIAQRLKSDAVVLVDPSAALVDPVLLDELVALARSQSHDLIFSPAAPGLCGALLKRPLVETLAAAESHPGRLLSYQAGRPGPDPLGSGACLSVPAAIARTTDRFTLDSDRQVERIDRCTVSLNGTLPSSDAAQLVGLMHMVAPRDRFPREVTLELTTRRAARPVGALESPAREDFDLSRLDTLLDQLVAVDDIRLVLGGAGDPLLHPQVAHLLRALSARQVATCVETDLLTLDHATRDALVEAPPDVLAVHIPAITQQTYAKVMGVDGLFRTLENLRELLAWRTRAGRGVPVVAPVFVKLPENLHEMEPWFEHWLGQLGSAVIRGPACTARGVIDMQPPTRGPCRRIESRLTILSDGTFVPCELDTAASMPLGRLESHTIRQVWTDPMDELRAAHHEGRLVELPVCNSCREWHRP